MPRKVSVYGLKPPQIIHNNNNNNNASSLTFPQPPDPTGQRDDGRERSDGVSKNDEEEDKKEHSKNDDSAIGEENDVAASTAGDVNNDNDEEEEDDDADNNNNHKEDERDNDEDQNRPMYDPTIHQNYRESNEAAWQEWHHNNAAAAGYNHHPPSSSQWPAHAYHHAWWGQQQPYYDDSQQQQQQQGADNNNAASAMDNHHHQYPTYQEFMPPLHKHDKEGGGQQQQQPSPSHHHPAYYYPPQHGHHNPNTNADSAAAAAATYNNSTQPPPNKRSRQDGNQQQVVRNNPPPPHHHIPPPILPNYWQQPPMHPSNSSQQHNPNHPYMMTNTHHHALTPTATTYPQHHHPLYNNNIENTVDKLPTYPYDDSFKNKSFEEMVDMLRQFNVEFPGSYDYEMVRLSNHDDNNDDNGEDNDVNDNNNDDNDDEDDGSVKEKNKNNKMSPEAKQDLIRSSWIKELRWQRRARAPSNEKSPKATRGRDKSPTFPYPLPDCLTLSPDRLMILEELNFNWLNDLSSWQKWLNDIMHYRARTKASNNKGYNNQDDDDDDEANIPLKYEEYPSLGNFVNRQRTEYRKLLQGRNSSMTQSKIMDLNKVGFQWCVREGGHTSWDIRLMELREYKRLNGHCNVPKIWKANPSLGYWVNEQRFQYRKLINNKPSYMNESKIAHLNALGFVWTLRESKKPWEDWLDELQKYKSIHGHLDVPLKYDRNPGLGAFVNNQRSEYRKLKKGEMSSMTEDKIRDLEAMGFKWSVRDSRTPWNTRWKELKSYKERFGNVNVPRDWEENVGLSYWVEKQRQQYKLYGRAPCHLTKERVDALNELGFDWTCTSEEDGMEEVEDAELEAEFETKQEMEENDEMDPK